MKKKEEKKKKMREKEKEEGEKNVKKLRLEKIINRTRNRLKKFDRERKIFLDRVQKLLIRFDYYLFCG